MGWERRNLVDGEERERESRLRCTESSVDGTRRLVLLFSWWLSYILRCPTHRQTSPYILPLRIVIPSFPLYHRNRNRNRNRNLCQRQSSIKARPTPFPAALLLALGVVHMHRIHSSTHSLLFFHFWWFVHSFTTLVVTPVLAAFGSTDFPHVRPSPIQAGEVYH